MRLGLDVPHIDTFRAKIYGIDIFVQYISVILSERSRQWEEKCHGRHSTHQNKHSHNEFEGRRVYELQHQMLQFVTHELFSLFLYYFSFVCHWCRWLNTENCILALWKKQLIGMTYHSYQQKIQFVKTFQFSKPYVFLSLITVKSHYFTMTTRTNCG